MREPGERIEDGVKGQTTGTRCATRSTLVFIPEATESQSKILDKAAEGTNLLLEKRYLCLSKGNISSNT